MAWALVAEDNWGVTARMRVDFKRPVADRTRRSAARAGSPARGAGSSTPRAASSTRRPATMLATADGTLRGAPTTTEARAAARYGFRLDGDDARHRWTRRRRRDDRATAADRRPRRRHDRERADRPGRRASSPSRKPAAEALGAGLAERRRRPGRVRRALDGRPAATRRPGVPRGPAARRARASAPSTASAGRCWPPSRAASAARPARTARPPLLFVADRLFREDRPRAALVRLRPARADARRRDPSAPGSSCAARRARPATGSPSTRLAHPYGTGIPAEPYRWAELEQLVYSPSRWERRLVGSTIATMTHVDRRRGRDPEVAGHAPRRRSASSSATPSRTSRRRSSWALSLARPSST